MKTILTLALIFGSTAAYAATQQETSIQQVKDNIDILVISNQMALNAIAGIKVQIAKNVDLLHTYGAALTWTGPDLTSGKPVDWTIVK